MRHRSLTNVVFYSAMTLATYHPWCPRTAEKSTWCDNGQINEFFAQVNTHTRTILTELSSCFTVQLAGQAYVTVLYVNGRTFSYGYTLSYCKDKMELIKLF